MLYQVILYKRDHLHGGHDATDIRSVGSVRAGELLGESLLRSLPCVTTNANYHRDTARASWVAIFAPNERRPVATVDAPVHVWPSVGELGWTP